ncbi:MAG TPA: sugar phosphate nucleotidyltransferase [Chthoniobacteraceae bacterium]|jgi:mannose-1-phosphate guanylyltransferase
MAPLYVLILAGGSGERFWPLSRKNKPKQLLSLFSKETLLEATLRRLNGLVPAENVLILTNADQEPAVRALCSGLPPANIVAEPAKRDTAAAIALGAAWISKRDPEATMIVLPADHLIEDTAGFQRTLRTAVSAAEQTGELVTIGIAPTWACPGFGYVEVGESANLPEASAGPGVFEVVRFREKPSVEQAESFLAEGNFRWNAGMFIWTVRAIVAAFQQHVPALGAFIREVQTAPELGAVLAERFPALPKISIDYAVLEKAGRVLMVESAFDWDDVGSWTAIAKYLDNHGDGNVGNAALQTVDAGNNIVYSTGGATIGLVGVSDLIVVQTGDALLICHRDHAEKIKQLVTKVPAELQ